MNTTCTSGTDINSLLGKHAMSRLTVVNLGRYLVDWGLSYFYGECLTSGNRKGAGQAGQIVLAGRFGKPAGKKNNGSILSRIAERRKVKHCSQLQEARRGEKDLKKDWVGGIT